MQGLGMRRSDPELKQIVLEASRALALLDAERLEELVQACRALSREPVWPADLVNQARDAAREMAVFARVLDATRGNLTVMKRLRDLRLGPICYAPTDLQPSRLALTEARHGDD